MSDMRSNWRQAVGLSESRAYTFTEVRAYFNWEARVRNGIPGSQLDDWLEAEKYMRENLILLWTDLFAG